MPTKTALALILMAAATSGFAQTTNPLPAETRFVSTPTAPATTPALPVTFSIATAENLQVTLTDLQVPSALSSATIVVTQGDVVSGQATLAAPATSATFKINGAVGKYSLWVFGAPGANFSVGTFSACVAPQSNPSACIQSASISGSITAPSSAANSTVSTFSASLTVTTAGNYTFSFSDLQFPAALATPPSLALFQGSAQIMLGITSGTVINLPAGTYTLLGVAQADATAQAGLYGISITGPPGTAPLLNTVESVGLVTPSSTFDNPAAQSVTLKVTDFQFPGALANATALLTAGSTALGRATAAGGAVGVAAPAGALTLWTYATAAATPGTFEADVTAGSSDLVTLAHGVSTGGSTSAYAFVTAPLTAGSYQATVTDLQFPSQLGSLGFAVAQAGTILKQSTTPATLPVMAAAGPLIFLVSAQTPPSGSAATSGLFDVSLQTAAASPSSVYDKTQSVSSTASVLDSQTLTLGVGESFDAALTDLMVPAQFTNLALVVSRGSTVYGKIYGGGKFSFQAAPGTYQLTFLADVAAMQQFGLYGVSVVPTPPSITSFTSNPATAPMGSPVTLSWTTSATTSCTGSGGSFSTNATSGSLSVVLSATTTYTLACTGPGGSVSKTLKVAASAAPSSGGGGELDLVMLAAMALLVGIRWRHRFRAPQPRYPVSSQLRNEVVA